MPDIKLYIEKKKKELPTLYKDPVLTETVRILFFPLYFSSPVIVLQIVHCISIARQGHYSVQVHLFQGLSVHWYSRRCLIGIIRISA